MCGWKDRCRDGNLRTYCHVSPILFGCFFVEASPTCFCIFVKCFSYMLLHEWEAVQENIRVNTASIDLIEGKAKAEAENRNVLPNLTSVIIGLLYNSTGCA